MRSIRFILLAIVFAASPLHAQTICADPGRDGNQLTLSGVVNTYFPATQARAAGQTSVTLGAATGASTPIAIGDLVLAIQMQDATINTGNNNNYGGNDGTGRGQTNTSNVGRYEFLRAASAVPVTGGTLTFVGAGTGSGLINSYAQSTGATGRETWQVIRVPQYRNATLAGAITSPYWNGSTGGVVVIDSVGKVSLNGQSIDVSSRGFRGGGAQQLGGSGAGADTDYRTLATNAANGSKGEGIAGTPRYTYNQQAGTVVDNTNEGYNNGSFARGAPGNGGGGGTDGNPGGNDENSGGGGGGNGGIGGLGGNTWQSNENRGGIGGAAFAVTAFDRVVMGGGGGAGTRNNSAGVTSSGGAGGGIVIIRAGYFVGPGSILATGATGPAPDNDGGGGGGAGGSIVLKSDPATTFNVLATITLQANGGAGADTWITEPPGGTPGARHGPGGGGAGGVIWTGSNMTTFAARQVNGGATGRTTTALDSYGANGGAGYTGTVTFTGQLPGVNPGYECVTTPVTLAFAASPAGDGKQLRWITATETGNVAFRIYEGAAGHRRPAATLPIASARTTTAERSDYSLALSSPPLDGQWWLGDVDVEGVERLSGPFVSGRRYGAEPADDRIDWRELRAKLDAPRAKAVAAPSATARLRVTDAGFQRITFEALLAAGVDLAGAPAGEIAVSRRGLPVARHVEGAATFGPGSAIEFYGEPEHSLYSPAGVYLVARDAAAVQPIAAFGADAGAPVATWSFAEATYAPERQYNIGSPTADPWYAERLLAYPAAPAAFATTLAIDAVATVPAVAAEARADLIGVTQWAGEAADHRVALTLDGGATVATTGDGIAAWTAGLAAPALGEGAHELRVVATGDAGYDFDLVYLDTLALRYPRLPVARAGRWLGLDVRTSPVPANAVLGTLPGTAGGARELLGDSFENSAVAPAGTSLVVHGLPGDDVVAYRRLRGDWQRVRDVRTSAEAGGFAAFVAAGNAPAGDWWVSTHAAMWRPAVEALPAAADLFAGPATWLAITHPAFEASLAPLVAQRRAQGLATDVVDVAQIYRRYSGGTPDPAAITAYLRDAVALRGTRYVVLAGGDTYDYADNLGIGSVSFVPTAYARTSEIIRFAPTDSLLADLDGDEVADLPIGRLPARSATELAALVAKVIAYEAGTSREALLVAGAAETGGSFRTTTDEFALQLPQPWQFARAYVDDLGVAGARSALLEGFGRGPGLVSFYGHSAPGQWTFDPIFTSADVGGLGDAGRPSLVLQWGCWNTYFVAPAANTLAHALLLTPERGAAAAFGSTALTEVSSHAALGNALFPRLATGTRLGDAVLAAQRAVANGAPARRDAWLGTALLGDPAMPLR